MLKEFKDIKVSWVMIKWMSTIYTAILTVDNITTNNMETIKLRRIFLYEGK